MYMYVYTHARTHACTHPIYYATAFIIPQQSFTRTLVQVALELLRHRIGQRVSIESLTLFQCHRRILDCLIHFSPFFFEYYSLKEKNATRCTEHLGRSSFFATYANNIFAVAIEAGMSSLFQLEQKSHVIFNQVIEQLSTKKGKKEKGKRNIYE